MYSKLVVGLAMAGAASAAEIVRRDTGGSGHGSHGASHGSSHGSSHGGSAHAAPSSSYSEPSAGYSAPASSYGAPAASYGAPAQSYGAPAQSYGAPAASYGSSGHGSSYHDVGGYEEDRFDLSVIIIPLLVLFGLSLLFPTIVNINASGGGRKRRSADDEGKVKHTLTLQTNNNNNNNNLFQHTSVTKGVTNPVLGENTLYIS